MACGAWTGFVDAIAGTAVATSSTINRLRSNRMESNNCGRTSEASVASEWESNWVGAVNDQLSRISSVVGSLFSSLLLRFHFRAFGLRFRSALPCHHLIRLTYQVLQFIIKQHIQSLQQNPFVATHIGRWADPFL